MRGDKYLSNRQGERELELLRIHVLGFQFSGARIAPVPGLLFEKYPCRVLHVHLLRHDCAIHLRHSDVTNRQTTKTRFLYLGTGIQRFLGLGSVHVLDVTPDTHWNDPASQVFGVQQYVHDSWSRVRVCCYHSSHEGEGREKTFQAAALAVYIEGIDLSHNQHNPPSTTLRPTKYKTQTPNPWC